MSICSNSAGKFGWVDGFTHVHVFVCNTVCILCVAYTYVHAMDVYPFDFVCANYMQAC